jgi:hypothetical protein
MIGQLSLPAAFSCAPNGSIGCIRGALRWVIRNTNPGAASASPVSSWAMRPLAIVLNTSAAYTMPSNTNSAA